MLFIPHNASVTLQRALNLLMMGLTWEEILIYMDDIIMLTPSFDIFLDCLEKVFQKLVQANLKLKPSKCFFLVMTQ